MDVVPAGGGHHLVEAAAGRVAQLTRAGPPGGGADDQQLAEDVVRETLVRAWQRPNIVNNRYSSVRPWLFTVARNLVNDHWRAREARPTEVSESELTAVAEERDQIDETVQAHAMRQAMARLSPEHRAVLAQVYYRGLTIADAAESLGIPVGTVKSRTYYALRSLRLILDELGLTTDPSCSPNLDGR